MPLRQLSGLYLGILIVSTTLPIFVSASGNPLDTLFAPMRGLNLVEFYNSNHYWIDFFLFLLIFIPTAKITIGRRFGSRDGNVLSGVIGVILALSLSLAEARIGFSIRSFGPIAAGIFIFIVGTVIFYLITHIGAGNTAAGSLAFIVTYFLMRATVPNFFIWLEENSWTAWINLVLVVAIMISILKLLVAILPKGESWSAVRKMEPSYYPDSKLRRNSNEESDQLLLIKGSLENITKKGIKESEEIIADLKEIIRIINEYGDTDKGRHLIADKIRQIVPRESLILKQLASLKGMNQKIEKADLGLFKELRDKWGKLPENEKRLLREEIIVEKKKILSDEKLLDFESMLIKYDKEFRYFLNMAIADLRSHQAGQAKDWLLKAVRSEEEAMVIFKEMKSLETGLASLTKMELKSLKREEQAKK